MTTVNAFGIDDEFGAGGIGLAPDGASDMGIEKPGNLRDILRSILGANWAPFANTAAMQASLAANRADGQRAVRLADYTKWTWQAGNTQAADANHIAPTDVGAGPGRWVADEFTDGEDTYELVHLENSTAVPIAASGLSVIVQDAGEPGNVTLPNGTDGARKRIVNGQNGSAGSAGTVYIHSTNSLGNDEYDLPFGASVDFVWITAAGGWVATNYCANVNVAWD